VADGRRVEDGLGHVCFTWAPSGEGLRWPFAVGTGNLRNRLEAENAAAAEFAQTGQNVLEAVDLAQRVQLIDDEPQALISLRTIHGLEDRQAHPG
jgi:hypothetical protein